MTKKQKPNREQIEAGITALKNKTTKEIIEIWHQYFEHKPAQYHREFMTKRIAYEMRAKIDGRLPPTAINKLKRLAYEDQKEVRGKITISAGTKLVRDWNGKRYEVLSLDDGNYEYDNKRYRSLSVIAQEITGAHWSGPLFFGLKKHPSKRSA